MRLLEQKKDLLHEKQAAINKLRQELSNLNTWNMMHCITKTGGKHKGKTGSWRLEQNLYRLKSLLAPVLLRCFK